MIGSAIALLKRSFPERQFLLRNGDKVRYLSLPGWSQAGALAILLALIGGMAGLAGAYHNLHKAIHRKEAEISARADHAAALGEIKAALARTDEQYLLLSRQLDDAKRQLDAAGTDNESLRGEIKAVEARDAVLDNTRAVLEQRLGVAQHALAGKTGNVKELASKLAESKGALKTALEARAGLQKKLAQLEADAAAANGRSERLKSSLAAREQDLRQVATERDRLGAELQQQIQPSGSQTGVSASRGYASRLEQLIASTGINLDRLLTRYETPRNIGGPFVALDPARLKVQDQERETALKSLVKELPLATPLGQYTVDSPFGPRPDPFNHKMGFHTGIDLGAAYRTPVLATAPGIVTFTGVKGEYGRVVEITHPHGIVTRYAHLHRILVAPGQHVRLHQEIGQLGSTGRSTGPHLHYEV
ncbi:MAG: peptidoglycan DD-metalloendopeptidase family protein, partial [Stellaceae bacterium]